MLGGGRRRHRVWLGWGRGGQRVWLGWGWGEGGICPSPVSCSDTSFITGRKEAISVGWGGGWRLQLHKGLAQPALLPLLHALGARKTMGRAAGEVSWPRQVKNIHSGVHGHMHAMHMCTHYTFHIYLGTQCGHPHQCSYTRWQTSTYSHWSMQQGPAPSPRTNGELIEGDSCGVVAQSVADTYRDLVLDGGEQVHVADVAAVLEGRVLLTDHNLGAMPGEG